MEKICVVGLGYIGLPTASLLATKGFIVHGVDVNENAVDLINRGEIPIYEPSLDILVKSAVNSGNLKADTKPSEADVFIIAVPTPFKEGKAPDLQYVEMAVDSIAEYIRQGNLIVLESTSPIGTTEFIAKRIKELRTDLATMGDNQNKAIEAKSLFYVVHSPERVLPGQILKELVENDRVIGGVDTVSAEKAKLFYRKFVTGKIYTTNARCAELCKLTENAFRDVNIAFANEMSIICDRIGVDVWELIDLANHHPRVNILSPGPGVGGHCIAVDPWFIVDAAPTEAKLIHMARRVNDEKPLYVLNKVREKANRFKNPIIACLGMSFKANIDDLRESPAKNIIGMMMKESVGKLLIVEPYIEKMPEEFQSEKEARLVNLEEAISQADIVLLLVDHQEFKEMDTNILKEKIVIDTRGILRG